MQDGIVSIPLDEFRRIVGRIGEFIDNPSLPNVAAKIELETLRMYDVSEYLQREKRPQPKSA